MGQVSWKEHGHYRMSREKSQPQTALQKLRAKQKTELAKYPRGSKEKARARERHKKQVAHLKEQQSLVARARAALPKAERKKLKPVRSLSPDTIRKEAEKVKSRGAKLKPKKTASPLKPPKSVFTTSKVFRIPSELSAMYHFLNRVYQKYLFTGQEFGEIRGMRAVVWFANGEIGSTLLLEPIPISDKEDARLYILDNVLLSDPTKDARDLAVNRIEIIISWNRDYLK